MHPAFRFKITILYLDTSDDDARRFATLIKQQPQLSVFDPEFIVFDHLKDVAHWVRVHRPQQNDAVTICCFDPSSPGIDPNASHAAVDTLVRAGLPEDCIIALPDPNQADLVWQVLRSRLDEENVLSKEDVLRNGQIVALAELVGAALAKRTSSGRRSLEFSVMRIEGDLKLLKLEVDSRIEEFKYRIEEQIAAKLSRDVEDLQSRLHTLEHTIFPARDLTGNPSLVTMVTSNRQMGAVNAKEIGKLDRDIGSLAEATKRRREADLEILKELDTCLKALEETVEQLLSQKHESLQLKLKRTDIIYTTGGKIILVACLVGLGIIVALVAPELLDLLDKAIQLMSQVHLTTSPGLLTQIQ